MYQPITILDQSIIILIFIYYTFNLIFGINELMIKIIKMKK